MATVDTATGEKLTRRVKTANRGGTLAARRGRLREAIAAILDPLPRRVGVSVIELPNARQQYGAQAERHALTWWLIDQLMARGPVVAVTPSQRAKLATGAGNAGKAVVLATVRAQHPGVTVVDDNAADALALAAAGAHWLGFEHPFTDGQATAFARVDWPS
ncbi:hypothetical protein [Microbacterium sp. AR7-10]|uniref:hypothetical protein n=1 Tax=Microbacterium sp. AR7-10 TaxID=1891970 RepID=UPI0008FC7292|nr:hypothetical protein [Microbacterium sp. AR7-10]